MFRGQKAGFPLALTIAGSDSGGGAGIQADLKTFAALGVYGASVVTALTAQNTRSVLGVWTPPPEFIIQQYEAVMADLDIRAAKTGMLATGSIIAALAQALDHRPIEKLVVDPVMISTSGDSLLEPAAIELLKHEIIPRALVVTPNIDEAAALTEISIQSHEDMKAAAKILIEMGARAALIKGGHMKGDMALDLFHDGRKFSVFKSKRILGPVFHGAGCTFSAAIAAHLALGLDLEPAIAESKKYMDQALAAAWPVGQGAFPPHHSVRFFAAAPPRKKTKPRSAKRTGAKKAKNKKVARRSPRGQR